MAVNETAPLPAIAVRDVTKLYRRWGRKRSFGTFKSALLSGRAHVLPEALRR